jgi:hypothetical protein
MRRTFFCAAAGTAESARTRATARVAREYRFKGGVSYETTEL